MDTVFDFVDAPHIFVEDRQVIFDNPVLRVEKIFVKYSKPDYDWFPSDIEEIIGDVLTSFIVEEGEIISVQNTFSNKCIRLTSVIVATEGKTYAFNIFINLYPYLAQIGVIEPTNISTRDLQRYFEIPTDLSVAGRIIEVLDKHSFNHPELPKVFVEDHQIIYDTQVLRVDQFYVNYSAPTTTDDLDEYIPGMEDIIEEVYSIFQDAIREAQEIAIEDDLLYQFKVINECIGLHYGGYVVDGKNYVFSIFINACPYLAQIGVIEPTNISARDLQLYFGIPIVVNQLQQGARRSRGSPDFEPSLIDRIISFF